MGSEKTTTAGKSRSRPAAPENDIVKRFNALRKSIQHCNKNVHKIQRRLHALTKEVKTIKKERDSHIKKVKTAERIERKLDAEKTKLKRKVLMTSTTQKAKQPAKVIKPPPPVAVDAPIEG